MKAERSSHPDPSLRVAWGQALASLRVRFWRHALTAVGVLLGTAFFAAMLALGAAETTGGDPQAENSRRMWLAGTSLAMCLCGVTNSMLMSVTERYREIGTIKCLGASDVFIVKVFAFEALLLGLVGAIAGAILGSGAMGLAVLWSGLAVDWPRVAGGAGVAGLAGLALTLASAIPPAVQAARMPAAAALRVEV